MKSDHQTRPVMLTQAQCDAVILLIESALNAYQGPNEKALKAASRALRNEPALEIRDVKYLYQNGKRIQSIARRYEDLAMILRACR